MNGLTVDLRVNDVHPGLPHIVQGHPHAVGVLVGQDLADGAQVAVLRLFNNNKNNKIYNRRATDIPSSRLKSQVVFSAVGVQCKQTSNNQHKQQPSKQ